MADDRQLTHLNADRVQQTLDQLCRRIDARFRNSGLFDVCRKLAAISKETNTIRARIRRPIYVVRILTLLVAAGFIAAGTVTFAHLRFETDLTLIGFIEASEAGANLLILLALGFFYLVNLESRIKRKQVVAAINRLRDIAHVIDMHQLTKDPNTKALATHITSVSPTRDLSPFELSRYLDYCSEMLSLVSKLGYLYIAEYNDPTATAAANELESLADGLSRKIWQKLLILRFEIPSSNGADGGLIVK